MSFMKIMPFPKDFKLSIFDVERLEIIEISLKIQILTIILFLNLTKLLWIYLNLANIERLFPFARGVLRDISITKGSHIYLI